MRYSNRFIHFSPTVCLFCILVTSAFQNWCSKDVPAGRAFSFQRWVLLHLVVSYYSFQLFIIWWSIFSSASDHSVKSNNINVRTDQYAIPTAVANVAILLAVTNFACTLFVFFLWQCHHLMPSLESQKYGRIYTWNRVIVPRSVSHPSDNC